MACYTPNPHLCTEMRVSIRVRPLARMAKWTRSQGSCQAGGVQCSLQEAQRWGGRGPTHRPTQRAGRAPAPPAPGLQAQGGSAQG